MTDVTIIVGDKSTYQILDQDSGAGEINPDRIYVPLTGDFSPGDQVWVSDDDSAETGIIQAIVANDYLDMTVNLTGLYTVAKNAKVCLVNNISNDVIDADTWRDRLTCIGRCKLRLENYGRTDKWGNTFASNDPIVVSINGTVVWQGFMDDVKPILPSRGVINNEIFLTGRDHGRILTDYNVTKKYPLGWAADIVDDILSILGDPLLYTDDGQYGGEVKIKYEGIRTDLGDALREICVRSGRDFYIDNTGRLHLFEAGAVDSTVDLDMVFGNAANNLLTFEEYEQVGFSIKNYIEIHAGSVKDHWTDETATSFTVGGAGAARSDEYTHYIFGTSSVELAANGAISQIYLDFSGGLFSYGPVIDLSKPCEAKVFIKGEITGLDEFNLRPYLIDSSARRITFKREGPTIWTGGKGNPKGWTDGIVDWNVRNVWSALSYPLGASDGNPIKAAETDKFWYGDTAFDWANVEIIGFEYQHVANGVVWIDGWCIPSIEARAIHENVASQNPLTGHGKRMYSELRNDMKSQKQLEDYAAALLSLRKDPIQKFKAVAYGQVDTKYAAQTVNVNVPDYDLNDDPYTITLLHHKIHHNKDVRGWDFVTEYELCAQDAPATIIIRDDNPMEILMDKLRRENRGFKGAMEADDILLGDVVSGNFMDAPRGIAFPATPANGDMFWLTADYDDAVNQYYGTASGLLYTFDDAIPKWVRGPANLGQRAANPPAGSGGGEYVGDTYLNTTDGITYQWDGAAWTQTAQPTIADATDFATVEWPATALKKGIQPFDSSVFFYAIRAAASDAVTFDIDVNDAGSGKTTITASAGTPFSYFTAGDEIIIQGCEEPDNNSITKSIDSVGGGGASITLTNMLGGVDTATDETCIVSARDAVRWVGANPAVWFADGTNQQVVSGDVNGLALGSHWIYFSTADTDAHTTNNYATAVGDTVGIICRLEVTATTEPLIMPVYSRGGNMTLDFLGAGAVDTLVLTSEQIVGKDIRTAYNAGEGGGPSGVKMTQDGIEIVGASGIGVPGWLLIKKDNATTVGWLDGTQYDAVDCLVLRSHNARLVLDVNGDTVKFIQGGNIVFDDDFDALIPTTTGNVDIGTAALKMGNIYGDLIDADVNLRIPAVNADPGALVNGDLWLRTDL